MFSPWTLSLRRYPYFKMQKLLYQGFLHWWSITQPWAKSKQSLLFSLPYYEKNLKMVRMALCRSDLGKTLGVRGILPIHECSALNSNLLSRDDYYFKTRSWAVCPQQNCNDIEIRISFTDGNPSQLFPRTKDPEFPKNLLCYFATNKWLPMMFYQGWVRFCSKKEEPKELA